MSNPRIRLATATDAVAVAALHADSWRRHYRGAYADSYLDGDLDAERLTVWTERLAGPTGAATLVAAAGAEIVGFAHVIFDQDPHWGSLVENLHVAHDRQRRGVGRRLMAEAGRTVVERCAIRGLHLWVLKQNVRAQRFYAALGGACVEEADCPPPGGIAERLHERPRRLRFAWSDATSLYANGAT